MDRIEALKEILPYVRTFQGKIFVIKVGGEICQDSPFSEVARQISLIRHIGINVVVVHGGGPQIDYYLDQLGIERKVIGGRRVTDHKTLQVAKMVYAGLVSTDIVASLREHGARAVGLTGVDAGLITATKRAVKTISEGEKESTVDFGFVGDITAVNLEIIDTLLNEGIIPVICSLGGDDNGEVYNINADTMASKLSQALRAKKLVLMTNVAGVLQRPGDESSLISYADIESLTKLIKTGGIQDGMLVKVESCLDAVRNGVPRTHIIDGRKPNSLLLELFVNEGCGTMIVGEREKSSYEELEGQSKV